MKIAIIGCGLIGGKRGRQLQGHELVGVYDTNRAQSEKLASELHSRAFESLDALFSANPEIVIVAVPNSSLAPVALRVLAERKHLLLEKPGAVSVDEVRDLAKCASQAGVSVKVGFNLRFHPALLKARELVDQTALGDLLFFRARYGHGGRLGYEKEWRSDPKIAGGGELLDQGVHLLDLVYSFFGPLPLQSSFVTTSFWKMPVEDNAVLTLADKKRWATFHVSCSEWKNSFALELYGKQGKLLAQGLGGSYGPESLTYYKMLPQMGPPEVQTFNFDVSNDGSWGLDLKNLVDHIQQKTPLLGDLASAQYALSQVREAYRSNGFKNLPCSV